MRFIAATKKAPCRPGPGEQLATQARVAPGAGESLGRQTGRACRWGAFFVAALLGCDDADIVVELADVSLSTEVVSPQADAGPEPDSGSPPAGDAGPPPPTCGGWNFTCTEWYRSPASFVGLPTVSEAMAGCRARLTDCGRGSTWAAAEPPGAGGCPTCMGQPPGSCRRDHWISCDPSGSGCEPAAVPVFNIRCEP